MRPPKMTSHGRDCFFFEMHFALDTKWRKNSHAETSWVWIRLHFFKTKN